ncbi:MAG: 3-phosphoshikimate 1-carboxyvinyltransferase [Firmicutes bacterium]|nr:3-phosphoshikimate 1-carboxyvinyltransferase [Bacillota bacterium]
MQINPIKSFNKTIYTSPCKSISHRAIILNSVAVGSSVITNVNTGADVLSTISCLQQLGAHISLESGLGKGLDRVASKAFDKGLDKGLDRWASKGSGDTVYISGLGDSTTVGSGLGYWGNVAKKLKCGQVLDCGNSGTTLRLLVGLLAGLGLGATFVGDNSLSGRPQAELAKPLRDMGADITLKGDKFLPLVLKPNANRLKALTHNISKPSAQIKSAILLAGLNAGAEVFESIQTRNHTELMLSVMQGASSASGQAISQGASKGLLKATNFEVPADISSGAFFIVLAVLLSGASVTLKNLSINETRTGILDVLDSVGANYKISNIQSGWEKTATLDVWHTQNLKPFVIQPWSIPRLVDEVPILAVLACFIKGVSHIKGAGALKHKETNRLKAVAEGLNKMGADIKVVGERLIINGSGGLKGGAVVDSFADHRIAMSLAIAGALSQKGVQIKGAQCVEISYPNFYTDLLGESR